MEILNRQWLITARCDAGVFINGEGKTYEGTSVERLFKDFEHSTDNGKTWSVCGVSE